MNINNLKIRQEEKSDHEKVYNLIKEAFKEMNHSNGDEQNLVIRMRSSNEFIPQLSLIAEINGEIVGHILFTKIKIKNKVALTLAPISVLPKYQFKGIGKSLIEIGHNEAKKLGYEIVVLVGHENYYPKFGYISAKDNGIISPFDVPNKNFMVKELKPNTLKNYNGLIEYSPMFFNK